MVFPCQTIGLLRLHSQEMKISSQIIILNKYVLHKFPRLTHVVGDITVGEPAVGISVIS